MTPTVTWDLDLNDACRLRSLLGNLKDHLIENPDHDNHALVRLTEAWRARLGVLIEDAASVSDS
jgi:hypothetical protein